MLRGLRKASSNWVGKSIMFAVVGFLVISFAIWGIGDIFRGFGQSSLAKVGDREVTIEQFRQIYNDRLQQIGRQIGRPITQQQARALGFDRQVLGQVIAEIALDERARQLGLNLSDDEVARRIREDPTFRGFGGQFDRDRFLQMIRSVGFTEPRFVAEQRRLSLRRQIAEAISGEVKVPETLTQVMSRYEDEQRSVEYVVLDPAKAGDIPQPTPEELAQYFEGRKHLFRAPEYRKATVIVVSTADALMWIAVSDDDARRAYEQRRQRYVTPERRRVQQIVFPSAADARAASERLAGGVTFEAIAAERELKDSDIDLGLVAKTGIVDRAVADAAFALKEGETSQPVEGRFGTALVRVTKIEPEHVRSYEEAAAELKQELAADRAKAEIQTRYDKIEDERVGGSQLAEIAQRLGLRAHLIDAVDRSGRAPDGAAVQLPPGVDILANIFASDVGVDNDPVQLPAGGYVWYEVSEVIPSRERNLDEVKDRVEARWRDDRISERLRAKTTEILDKLKAGTSLADIAAAEGLKVETASGLKRNKPTDALSATALDDVFRTGKGTAAAADGRNPPERVVFRVTDTTVPSATLSSEEANRIADQLKRSIADDLIGQYLVRLQNDLGVRINENALRQVVGAEN